MSCWVLMEMTHDKCRPCRQEVSARVFSEPMFLATSLRSLPVLPSMPSRFTQTNHRLAPSVCVKRNTMNARVCNPWEQRKTRYDTSTISHSCFVHRVMRTPTGQDKPNIFPGFVFFCVSVDVVQICFAFPVLSTRAFFLLMFCIRQ